MDNIVDRHCRELERCNQRVGRMLSVADLIDADALSLPLAAAVTARIAGGASFMVGANPGGAGKTTVLCALLNFVPPDCALGTCGHIPATNLHADTLEETMYHIVVPHRTRIAIL